MTNCPSIYNFELDRFSRETIKDLKRRQNIGSYLGPLLSLGVFSSIFTKNTSWNAAINITQTDWEMYSNAVYSSPGIVRKAIEKEAAMAVMHYQLFYDYKHLEFWKGIHEATISGCDF